jgi:hypothetical protein
MVVPLTVVLPNSVVPVDGGVVLGVVVVPDGWVVVLVFGTLDVVVDVALGVDPPQAASAIAIAPTTDTAVTRRPAVRCIDFLVSHGFTTSMNPTDICVVRG